MMVLVVCIKNQPKIVHLYCNSRSTRIHVRASVNLLVGGQHCRAWLRQPYASLLIAGYLCFFFFCFFYVRLYVTANVN